MSNKVDVGAKAPDFSLESDEGTVISLSSLRGHPVVLYFYPKDETPGCTKEACDFRDAWAEVQALGARVLGVSKDSTASHRRFRQHHALPFPLLADPEGKVIEAYGAFKEKTMWGRTFLGIERSTFLIDGQGVVRKVWRKVKVDGHARAVLESLRDLDRPEG